ncbi:hypothetical protein ELH99_09485 [Rhizobium leguminosarum]|uniref:hypothetical protein n=1 Tax=Rhizobium leguminosarum TaxID=384 RepID=UPI00102F814A|nr:hypothetical protein [Rhizobium leguminosarum]TAX50374.1 hypothetical protein ELH99_09485 [Rhizobium leguminosarum]
MATYFLSFRIADKTVNGKSYAERRQAMIDAVRTKGHGFWDGTTSFLVVESGLSTQGIAANASAALSSSDDMLVAIDPEDMSMRYFGKVGHSEVLSSFFKFPGKA